MTNPPTKSGSSSDSNGVRPLVMLGGKLGTTPASTSDQSQSSNAQPKGDWAFEYRPGADTMTMSVHVDQSMFLSNSNSGELTMEIDAKGVTDIIAWLYGVKNSIASAASSSSNTNN